MTITDVRGDHDEREPMPLGVDDLRVVATGLDHPEGVAVDRAGTVWCGGEAGQLYRVDPATGAVEQVADLGGFCLGVACDAAAGVYVCVAADHPAVLRYDGATGAVSAYCATADGTPLMLPNFAAFDAGGTLWLSDSGTEAIGARDGRLLAVPPGGGDAAIVCRDLAFPNGLAIGADGRVHGVDTLDQVLWRVEGATLEPVADLTGHSPDGLVALAGGGFIVACYYPFRLLHVPPAGGGFSVLLDDATGIHLPMPTNAAFLADDGTVIVLGSLGGQALCAIDVGVRGVPPHRPGA